MTDHTTYHIRAPFGDRGEVVIHNLDTPDSRGMLAMKILDHFSLISAKESGEDSAGRQKLKLMAPSEVAARACDLADAFFGEIERRGWLLKMPSYEDIQAAAREAEAKRKADRRAD